MFDILLNNKLVNRYLKKALERYLNKDLGDEARIVVNDLQIEDQGGFFSARIEANFDITKDAAKQIIGL